MTERISLTAFVTCFLVSIYFYAEGHEAMAYMIWAVGFSELLFQPSCDAVKRWWDRHCDEHGQFQPRWLMAVVALPLGLAWLVGAGVTLALLIAALAV